jgi:microcystin-dependent protein
MTQAINLANFSNSLDSSGGVPPSQLNASVPVSKGGTGAATAADARTNLDVYSTSGTNSAILVANPTGEIKMWPTVTAPTGYLLCAGTAISRTTYATLFAVIGTTFGAGDGTTTFNIPDFRDRMPIGAGTTYALNAAGGSADATLPSHTHTGTSTVTDPGHSHNTYNSGNIGNNGGGQSLTKQAPQTQSVTSSFTGITVSTSISTVGASPTGANLPPYRGIYFIIKT